MPARILIADDHEVIRTALKATLENQPGWQVCCEAQNGREAVDKAVEYVPDVVIVDLSMPELNGLEAATRIHEVAPEIPVLLYTVYHFPALDAEAARLGIRQVVDKAGPVKDLLRAVTNALGEKGPRNGRAKAAGQQT
jgi:DNA-binding NarL/FixJ family response regulator